MQRSAIFGCRWSAVACVALLACHATSAAAQVESFLHPMGPVAGAQRDHLIRIVVITMVVILPVLIGVPAILWRYRRNGGKGTYTPGWDFSARLEYLLWGLPAVVVLTLGAWLWHQTAKFDPYDPLGSDPLQVQVVGLDWKWVFIYPQEGIATVNELAIPVGRPVELSLTTDTVMQSFLVAPLAGQVYAMPGMTTKLNFLATRKALAEGENTQFNGTGFGRQKFTVRALSPEGFATWKASARGGPALDAATYDILRRKSVLADARADLGLARSAEPILMPLVDRDIFRRVVGRYHSREGTE